MRRQKPGKQKIWNIADLKKGFEKFNTLYGHYPASHEIDTFAFLPSARSIQRSFGGLVHIRKELGFNTSFDLRTGEYSSNRAKKINARAHTIEKSIYDYLVTIFGVEYVHREYFFTDDRRTRTDFFVYCRDGNFSADVFFPNDKRNFIGCLNSKMRTYKDTAMLQYPVIFLQMNEWISKEEIQAMLARKKNKLRENQQVMTFDEFKLFCARKVPKKGASLGS